MGKPSVTPPRIPPSNSAASFSICMRPPRPWPCCRRARPRATKSVSIRSPAGTPSRIAVKRRPWDSPAVVSRSGIPESLSSLPRLLVGSASHPGPDVLVGYQSLQRVGRDDGGVARFESGGLSRGLVAGAGEEEEEEGGRWRGRQP